MRIREVNMHIRDWAFLLAIWAALALLYNALPDVAPRPSAELIYPAPYVIEHQ